MSVLLSGYYTLSDPALQKIIGKMNFCRAVMKHSETTVNVHKSEKKCL